MYIFINVLFFVSLAALSVTDLLTKRLPFFLLITLTGAATGKVLLFMTESNLILMVLQMAAVILLGGSAWLFSKAGWLGRGDIWVFTAMSLMLPAEKLLSSVGIGLMHAGIMSMLLMAEETWIRPERRREVNKEIPLVPFLFWGYLFVAGGQIW